MKKMLTLLVLAVFLLSAAGCGSAQEADVPAQSYFFIITFLPLYFKAVYSFHSPHSPYSTSFFVFWGSIWGHI